MVFHIRSISKERLVKRLGKMDKKELNLAIDTLGDILRY
jgi:mRNA interferase MazF